MDNHEKEWHEIQAAHLNTLTSLGRHYTGIAEGAIETLRRAYAGEIELSDEDMRGIWEGLTEAVKKHAELIRRSLKEQQSYFDSVKQNKQDD